MSQFEEALTAIIVAHAGYGTLAGDRFYPLVIPQGVALPAATYERVSDQTIHASGADQKTRGPRVRVTAWGSTYASAKALAAQIVAALRDYTGTSSSVTIQRIFYEGDSDGYEADTERYFVDQDFICWYVE